MRWRWPIDWRLHLTGRNVSSGRPSAEPTSIDRTDIAEVNFEMRTLSGLWIDRSARPTLQDQLARQIRERIRSGDLDPGDPLPSTRDLASELKLSRNTAVYAYERLISEGYLESASRAGIFVSRSITIPRDTKRPAIMKNSATRSRTLAAQPHLGAPRPF